MANNAAEKKMPNEELVAYHTFDSSIWMLQVTPMLESNVH